MIRKCLMAAILTIVAPAMVAVCQTSPNLQRGFDASKAFQVGEIDSINLFNGNMVLGVPLGLSYPIGGGLSFGMNLAYNSQGVWDYSTRVKPFPTVEYTVAELASASNAGMGWELSLGRLCWPDCTQPGTGEPISFVYESPDGGTHRFLRTLHVGETPDSGQKYWYTRDGSYLRLNVKTRDENGDPATVDVGFPDGQIKSFSSVGSESGVLRLVKTEDRSGNWVKVSYSTPNKWAISDSQGRQYGVYFGQKSGCSAEVDCTVVDKVDVPGFAGSRSSYTFSYEVRQIDRSCLDQRKEVTGRDPGNPFAPFLVSITRPDGSVWKMGDGSGGWYYSDNLYDDNGLCSVGRSGALFMLQGPLGAQWHWDYGSFKYPSGDVNFLVYGMGVVMRQTTVGGVIAEWTYDRPPAVPLAETVTTTVTSPEGDDTVNYFDSRWNVAVTGGIWLGWDYGLPYTRDPAKKNGNLFRSREEYEGTGANRVLVRKVYIRYEHDKLPGDPQHHPPVGDPGSWYDTNRRVKERKTVYADDGGKWTDVVYSGFDGMGHFRQAESSATASWSGEHRSSFTDFNPNLGTYEVDADTNDYTANHNFTPWPTWKTWILGTFSKKDITEVSQTARTEYCFDWGAGNRGLLLRKRILRDDAPADGSGRSADDIITTYSYDAEGNMTSEKTYGGDINNHDVGTGDLCTTTLGEVDYQIDNTYENGVLKTSSYEGRPYYDVDRDIDKNTGLVKTERDAARFAVTMTYDNLGRLTKRVPAEGARTEITYTILDGAGESGMKVGVRYLTDTVSGTVVHAEEELVVDGLGRPTAERRKMPGDGWSEKLTEYDVMGRVSRSSTVTKKDATKRWTSYIDYDRWGRPASIKQPDDSTISMAFAGIRQQQRTVAIGTTKTGAQAFTVTTLKDPFGRVVSVTEPTGDGDVTSTYNYDVANRLVEATISAPEGTQTRSFKYDNRGFLTWERMPEKGGSSGNGIVSYSSYDTLGHAHRVIDGPNDLSYTYDAAGRLTQIKETGSGRVVETRAYGTSNGTAWPIDRRLGKLVTAVRHNYYNGAGDPSDLKVEEDYEYRGLSGAVSKRRTTITWPVYSVSFDQYFTWNELGALEKLDYPKRGGVSGWRGAGPGREIRYWYNEGFLTAVPGYAQSISYHWNGMIDQVKHATGVIVQSLGRLTEYHVGDPSGMARPSQIYTKHADSDWDSGDYTYDDAGNITKIGSNWYLYDGMSRLKEGTARLGNGTIDPRSYEYDGFGNLTKLNGRTIDVNDATNRLTGSSYDAAGNELSWGTGGLTYDYTYYPTNQIRTIKGGSPAVTRIYAYTADGGLRELGTGRGDHVHDPGSRGPRAASAPGVGRHVELEGGLHLGGRPAGHGEPHGGDQALRQRSSRQPEAGLRPLRPHPGQAQLLPLWRGGDLRRPGHRADEVHRPRTRPGPRRPDHRRPRLHARQVLHLQPRQIHVRRSRGRDRREQPELEQVCLRPREPGECGGSGWTIR